MIIRKGDFDQHIESAECDCCRERIELNIIRQLPNHVIMSGTIEFEGRNKLIESIICENCFKSKFDFIRFTKRDNTIGYC